MAIPFGYNFTLILVVSIKFFYYIFLCLSFAFLGKVNSPCLQLLRMVGAFIGFTVHFFFKIFPDFNEYYWHIRLKNPWMG
jgi:hypothetical protein